jgi:hypothetical protein
MTDRTSPPSAPGTDAADATHAKAPPSKTPDRPQSEAASALEEAIDRATAAVGEDDGKR